MGDTSEIRAGLDLLAALPLAVVEADVWPRLDSGDCRQYRLMSTQSRQLTDQLLASANLQVDFRQAPGALRADAEAASTDTQQYLEQHAAFLSHLPSLTSFHLTGWLGRDDLNAALQRCSSAAPGRVQQLRLSGLELSPPSMLAARAAFPELRQLRLEGLDCNPDARHNQDSLPYGTLCLRGRVFEALQGSGLTKLVLSTSKLDTGGQRGSSALSSLVGLPSLRHLVLDVETASMEDLQFLSRLYHLQHCGIRTATPSPPRGSPQATASGVVAQLMSTQLTSLKLHLRSDTDRPPTLERRSLLQLGRMECLRSLDLHDCLNDDDGALFSLACLTQLTELGVGGIQLAAPSPGHLPRLQRLRIFPHRALAPSLLLSTLLPLLPLSDLVSITGGGRHEGGGGVRLLLDARLAGGDTAAARATALQTACKHLAEAPQLVRGGKVGFQRVWHPGPPVVLSLAQMTCGLWPLAGHVSHISIEWTQTQEGAAPWRLLQAALTSVRQLTLTGGPYTSDDVTVVVQSLISLEILTLEGYNELAPGTQGGWEVVVAACSRTLRIESRMTLTPEVLRHCQAVQEQLFGTQFVTWALYNQPCLDAIVF